MNIDQFDEWVREFATMTNYLQGLVNTRMPSARNILVSKNVSHDGVDPRQVAELELRKLSDIIEALMAAHDKIYDSIDMSPRYADFLRQHPS